MTVYGASMSYTWHVTYMRHVPASFAHAYPMIVIVLSYASRDENTTFTGHACAEDAPI